MSRPIGLFTFGIARTSLARSLAALLTRPTRARFPGLVHAECMTAMRLGSPILSSGRLQLRTLTMFAAWEDEQAVVDFHSNTSLGKVFESGWHVRMSFLRKWGSVRELADLPEDVEESDPFAPVAAYTLARLKIPEAARFFRCGRPVEQLVRDHPETTLALAAIRYPRSVATFSVWNTQHSMTEMVQGHGNMVWPDRHAVAMQELNRRNFHREFTTLRFKPLSEHGCWNGRTAYLPSPCP